MTTNSLFGYSILTDCSVEIGGVGGVRCVVEIWKDVEIKMETSPLSHVTEANCLLESLNHSLSSSLPRFTHIGVILFLRESAMEAGSF